MKILPSVLIIATIVFDLSAYLALTKVIALQGEVDKFGQIALISVTMICFLLACVSTWIGARMSMFRCVRVEDLDPDKIYRVHLVKGDIVGLLDEETAPFLSAGSKAKKSLFGLHRAVFSLIGSMVWVRYGGLMEGGSIRAGQLVRLSVYAPQAGPGTYRLIRADTEYK